MSFWARFKRSNIHDVVGTPCVVCREPSAAEVCAACESGLACSFCGKPREDVAKLIAGERVTICDECVDLSRDILVEESSTALEYAIRDLMAAVRKGSIASADDVTAAFEASLTLARRAPHLLNDLAGDALRCKRSELAAKILEAVPNESRDSPWASLVSQARFDCGDFDGAIRALDSVEHDDKIDALRAHANRAAARLAKSPPCDDLDAIEADLVPSEDIDYLVGAIEDELLATIRFADALWLHRKGLGSRAAKRFAEVAQTFGERLSEGFLVMWGECLAAIEHPRDAEQKWQAVVDSSLEGSYWSQRARALLDSRHTPYR